MVNKKLLLISGIFALIFLWRTRMNEAQLIMARTIYGEARGEGYRGMKAVANVIMNRAKIGGWWGDSIITVCKKPWQFSAWNKNDPNAAIIAALMPKTGNNLFDTAYELAGDVIAGSVPDITNGATHYHTAAVNPTWDDNMLSLGNIGNHQFYKKTA